MMKFFLVLLFVGCASATLLDALKKASDEVVRSIRDAMDEATPLHEVLGIEENEELNRFQNDVKDELIAHVKEVFRETIRKIEDAMDRGKKVPKEAIEKLRELEKMLHTLKIEDHEIEGFKDKLSDKIKGILEGLGIFDKRSVDDLEDPMESMLGDLSFRDFLLRIKQYILEKMDVSSLKLGLKKVVKQASQALCNWLTNKGQDKLNNFFDRVLEEENEESRKRSVSDLYEQLKDYFDDLHLDFKQKFSKFGDWVKSLLETGLEKSKDKIENVRKIARELIVRSKDMSKDAAAEALEFLHRFKDELGHLYEEAREKVMKKILDYTD